MNFNAFCEGVPVSAGDIIVADQDGAFVASRADASAVLALARKLDFQEHSMCPYTKK